MAAVWSLISINRPTYQLADIVSSSTTTPYCREDLDILATTRLNFGPTTSRPMESNTTQRKRRRGDDLAIDMREQHYAPAGRARRQSTLHPRANTPRSPSAELENHSKPEEIAMLTPISLKSHSTTGTSRQSDRDSPEGSKPPSRKRRRGDDLTIDLHENHYAPADRGRRQKSLLRAESPNPPPQAPLTPVSLKSPGQSTAALGTKDAGLFNRNTITNTKISPKVEESHVSSAHQHKIQESAHDEPVEGYQPIQGTQNDDSSEKENASQIKRLCKPSGRQLKSEAAPLPSENHPPKIMDDDPGFMPSERNGFRFEFGNPKTGRTAQELNDLFEPTEGPVVEIQGYGIGHINYDRTGDLPLPGLAKKLVAEMEKRQKRSK